MNIVKLVVYCTILFYEQIMFECVRKVTCQINEINADEPYHMKAAVSIIFTNFQVCRAVMSQHFFQNY
jgi:hypothetical protein